MPFAAARRSSRSGSTSAGYESTRIPRETLAEARCWRGELQAGSEATCARQILSGFARRASECRSPKRKWVRLKLVDDLRAAGNTYEDGLKAALRSILLSAHFLYMVEKARPGAAGGVAPLKDHELATRLSYYFWSTMPDAALSAAADAGELAVNATKFAAETQRMLTDPKALALTENFVGQWLTLRRLALDEPDKKTFPTFDASLKDAAAKETELFFGELINQNSPIESLLTGDFTFVNGALRKHYGIPGAGTGFERVSLSNTPRVGILTQASFLIANSHPAFTSPTKRGAWVLGQLLCEAPPYPAGGREHRPDGARAGESARDLAAQSRESGLCRLPCLDGSAGLGLEQCRCYRLYHDTEGGKPIDATGELQGTSFSGARELAALLSRDPRWQVLRQTAFDLRRGRSCSTTATQQHRRRTDSDERAAGRHGVRDLIGPLH